MATHISDNALASRRTALSVTEGGLVDLERQWVLQVSSIVEDGQSIPDLWSEYLTAEGYFGTLQDMQAAYLIARGYTGSLADMWDQMDWVISAGTVPYQAQIYFDEGTGSAITPDNDIPNYTVLGTTTGIWANADRITYHSGGNPHARIVGNASVDNLFRQDDIDGTGVMLIFVGLNYPAEPSANQRLWHYGNNGGVGATGGINMRINGGGASPANFSMAVHANEGSGTDIGLVSSDVSVGVDHTLACILDWTTAGDCTATWYIDGTVDTTVTSTLDAPLVSAAGTLRGLTIAARNTSPVPDTKLTDAQMWGLQFYKYADQDATSAIADIATLHADFTANLGY